MKAYRYWEDGRQWLRIIPDNGLEYDEPITGWEEILNLTDGSLCYRKGGIYLVGEAMQ